MRIIILLVLSIFFLGCTPTIPPHLVPVIKRSHHPVVIQSKHIVKKGESLYQIAWRYGLDYKKLAADNRLKSPYRLKPRQVLYLHPIKKSRKSRLRHQGNRTASSIKRNTRYKKITAKSKRKKRVRKHYLVNSGHITHWQWPATGSVIRKYSLAHGSKGIDLKGRKGDPVRATANGVVVYSGSGLRGYGKLIIIKHNKHFLTAYGHNSKILVKVEQKVKAKRKIAEMGNTESRQTMLHFEIRKNGKPVNPLNYLPKRLAR